MDCSVMKFMCVVNFPERRVVLSKDNPLLEEVVSALKELSFGKGVAELRVLPEPETGPYKLTVRSDGEVFLIHFLCYDFDSEPVVKEPVHGHVGSELISFEGEKYPGRGLVSDFSIVERAFLEFLESGDISSHLFL